MFLIILLREREREREEEKENKNITFLKCHILLQEICISEFIHNSI
jgi:hypothetical protein